jgi:hypothetical protein
MSLTWMAVVAVLILAQKLLPGGKRLTRVFAVLFLAAGIWVASAPGSVPRLTLPDSDAAQRARMRMMGVTPGSEVKPGEQMQPGSNMQPGTETGTQMEPMEPGG